MYNDASSVFVITAVAMKSPASSSTIASVLKDRITTNHMPQSKGALA